MSKRTLTIQKVDNVSSVISTDHPSIMRDLYNYFSVYVDGFKFMPKYKLGLWDGKVHFMDKSGKFPSGLLKHVYNFVKHDDLIVEIDRELMDRYDEVDDDLATITNEWMSDTFIPYTYQFEGALKAIKYKRGILEHATSAGKSLTMSMICIYLLKKKLADKILILVPSLGLIEQLKNDFISYGVPEDFIGTFSGFNKDTKQPIIISTWQSMHKQPELIRSFTGILADECHGLKANVIRSVSENAVNAKYRIGCTGTLPDPKSDRLQIEGTLGPVLHKITARELIDGGQSSDIIIKVPFITYPESITSKLKGLPFETEKEWLEKYDPRNNIIKSIVKKHRTKEHNCLILADHIDHANTLYEKIKTLNSGEVFLVTGSMPAKERERIRQYANEHKNVTIVASYGVFSTGISIKRLHCIIFASAGKSKIKILQSVGRGLRLHKDKNKLILYDIGDNLKFSEKHLQLRIDIYTKAQFDLDVFEVPLKEK